MTDWYCIDGLILHIALHCTLYSMVPTVHVGLYVGR